MGKGSGRRPAGVDEGTLQSNWERTFGAGQAQQQVCKLCQGTKEAKPFGPDGGFEFPCPRCTVTQAEEES